MNIPLNIDWQQILLHLLNFAILAGGLYLLLYKPVKAFMEQRQAYYQGIDTQAAEKLKDAERLEATYQAKLSSVDEAAARKRAAAQRETERMVQQQLSDARAQADQIIANAHAAAQREYDKALAEAQDELKELAVTATEKLVLQAKGDAFDQFLELAERGGSHE